MNKFLINLKGAGKEKGSTLVEILLAMTILAILLIGILQMFSAAYVLNMRSASRTLQAYKCQQVAEVLRLYRMLQTVHQAPNLPQCGLNFVDNEIYALPYNSTCQNWDFWGPTGANVIENENGGIRLFVRITQPPGQPFFNVNVSAVSDEEWVKKGQPSNIWEANLRRVEYVTRIQ